MDERERELLKQIEDRANEVRETISRIRLASQNEADEEIYFNVLNVDVSGLNHAWENLKKHREPTPAPSPGGPFDLPEN